ncbi:hypothetical protein DM02DRAFT_632660 [Periconia macrospinosa]|uniref:Uncharacterized protein n=1 Tax=Periconia macrospinosa TaxID=97972 RepID=A0A2V1DEU4_9PLEO|nr:hypothetical protein DM02DRAFT_632660 [Periconia macrospinosa]
MYGNLTYTEWSRYLADMLSMQKLLFVSVEANCRERILLLRISGRCPQLCPLWAGFTVVVHDLHLLLSRRAWRTAVATWILIDLLRSASSRQSKPPELAIVRDGPGVVLSRKATELLVPEVLVAPTGEKGIGAPPSIVSLRSRGKDTPGTLYQQ